MLSPMLAAKLNTSGERSRREFVKLQIDGKPDGVHIASQLPRWNWAFLEARDALGYDDISVAAIVPCRYFTVKRTSTYNRKFRRGREMVKEAFEALPTGQVVEFGFTLSLHLPPHGEGNGRFVRPPDVEEFDNMLAHIGEHLGMSEWGHAYLYGRFKLYHKHEISDNERRGGDDRHPGHTAGQEVPDHEVETDGQGEGQDTDAVEDGDSV